LFSEKSNYNPPSEDHVNILESSLKNINCGQIMGNII